MEGLVVEGLIEFRITTASKPDTWIVVKQMLETNWAARA
jgi:hypothetical protein